jgi:hypothetical protein
MLQFSAKVVNKIKMPNNNAFIIIKNENIVNYKKNKIANGRSLSGDKLLLIAID